MATAATHASLTETETAELRSELERLRAENERLRAENERLRDENCDLHAALDMHVARAGSTSLYGPLELTAGTCIGPRRRTDVTVALSSPHGRRTRRAG